MKGGRHGSPSSCCIMRNSSWSMRVTYRVGVLGNTRWIFYLFEECSLGLLCNKPLQQKLCGMAPRIDLISFWHSGHPTSEVNFGLWPHLVGLNEYIAPKPSTNMQFPSKSDQGWLVQPSFIILPISLFLACGLYLKHFFRIFGQGWAPWYWGVLLELIWYNFDRVVIWPLRSALASGLFCLVWFWLKIFQTAP